MKSVISLIFLLGFVCLDAAADSRARVFLDRHQLQELFGVGNLLDISVVQPGLGRTRFRLSKVSSLNAPYSVVGRRTDRRPIVFLQGEKITARNRGLAERGAATLSRQKGVMTLRLFFPGEQKNGSVRAFYEWYINFDGSKFTLRAKRAPARLLRSKSCAAKGDPLAAPSTAVAQGVFEPLTAPTAREIELSTEADAAWYRRYRADSNVQIAAIVNTADAIYSAELGLRFRLIAQHVFKRNPKEFEQFDPVPLLKGFQNYSRHAKQLGIADEHMLFSNKGLVANYIGFAYVGVICLSPNNTYGLINHYSTFDPYLFAHESGHMLGADHDPSEPPTIMNPVIQAGATTFSEFSRSQITEFVSVYGGQCLSPYGAFATSGIPAEGLTQLTFNLRPNRSRETVRAEIAVAGVVGSNCSYQVRYSSSKAGVAASHKVWNLSNGSSGSYASDIRSIAYNARGRRQFFGRAEYFCPGMSAPLISEPK